MIWAKIASVLMFLGVALGAFASHALRDKLSPYSLEVFKTAVLYHFIHSLGLFAVAWLSVQTANPKFNLAGIFLTAGIVLFSGSLYLLAVTGTKWLGPITPVGGLCFLIGWAIVIYAVR